MHKLTVTLKQHTPLIHFQHDQEGATLRASEVKPKLDRFILTKLGGDEGYEAGIQIAKDNGWLVGKGDHPALDYKMRIKAEGNVQKDENMPMYFGNMGDGIEKKMKQADSLEMIFFSLISSILDQIKNIIADFFIKNNFGSRQSKGYGCFEVVKINDENIKKRPSNYVTFFSLKGDFKGVFGQIQLLYNSMRSGVNLLDRDGKNVFYFKSLLFLYAKSLGVQWEKKTIKEHFANDIRRNEEVIKGDLSKQQEKFETIEYKDSCPLFFSSKDRYIIKDLFGLSSSEAWKSYKFKPIEKIHSLVKTDKEIQRFKSPLLIKVYEDGGNYTIYFLIDRYQNDILRNEIMGQKFYIVNGKYRDSKKSLNDLKNAKNFQCFPISIVPASLNGNEVSLDKFFNYILFVNGGIDLDNYVEQKFQKRKEFSQLKCIYNQMKQNYVNSKN